MDLKAAPESYAPLEVVKRRIDVNVRFIRLLCSLTDYDHPDWKVPQVRFLRSRYMWLFFAYQRHNTTYERGWDLPEWANISQVEALPAEDVLGWSLEAWYTTERDVPRHIVSTHLGVFRSIEALRRPERRVWNTTSLLLAAEVEAIDWALSPDRTSKV